MKRLLTLLMALLLTVTALPALAWEVSPEIEALAAAYFPGHGVLDGFMAGDRTALLLTTPSGETRLAFCTEDSAAMTQPLPEMLFWIADAQLFDDTAMLLVEDYAGTVYFVGCVRAEEGWVAKVSTPLPEGTELRYASEDGVTLYWERRAPIGGGRSGYAFEVEALADGRWLVVSTTSDAVADEKERYISYHHGFVRTERRCLHGEQLFTRDVTEIKWLLFPTTLEDVAAQMDLSGWAILTEAAALCDAPDGIPLAQFNPGAHLLILDYVGDWVNVAPGGSVVSGWLPADVLCISTSQLEITYCAPDDCPVANRGQNALDVYLYPSDAADNPLLVRLTGRDAYPVYAMALWSDGTWTLIYDQSIPGGVGFVRTERLNAEPANGWG